jgi:hypothetical protein
LRIQPPCCTVERRKLALRGQSNRRWQESSGDPT